ncbi:MAG: hypothetical protein JST94_09185 [Bacteroidetes bacterium]|nr:hypothetical protein [Bacteroidota bacterium]MBS1671605.1 hypothetical protein [Bacteroidota bacterium]
MKTSLLLNFLVAFLLLTSASTLAQVRLPRSFKCIKSTVHWRGNFYSDGIINLHYEFHVSYEPNEESKKDFIANESSQYPFKFKKTFDNLYVGYGVHNGMNFYVILVSDNFHSFTVSSKYDDNNFSQWSTWLLVGVRKDRGSFSFTDFYGNDCITPSH